MFSTLTKMLNYYAKSVEDRADSVYGSIVLFAAPDEPYPVKVTLIIEEDGEIEYIDADEIYRAYNENSPICNCTGFIECLSKTECEVILEPDTAHAYLQVHISDRDQNVQAICVNLFDETYTVDGSTPDSLDFGDISFDKLTEYLD